MADGNYVRKRRGPFTCCFCGVSYTTARRVGEGERFCSRECSFAHKARDALIRAAEAKPKAERQPTACVDCGVEAEGRSLRCAVCKKSHAVRLSVAGYRQRHEVVKTCPYCAVKWCSVVRVGIRQHCYSAECLDAYLEDFRRARRVGKCHERRAKRHGVERHYFASRSVLERDGWRCKLCGVKTPERLRGTVDPRAPELDHIVPLSRGGGHTKMNTQCACRKCNSAKGATPMGQTLLFG